MQIGGLLALYSKQRGLYGVMLQNGKGAFWKHGSEAKKVV